MTENPRVPTRVDWLGFVLGGAGAIAAIGALVMVHEVLEFFWLDRILGLLAWAAVAVVLLWKFGLRAWRTLPVLTENARAAQQTRRLTQPASEPNAILLRDLRTRSDDALVHSEPGVDSGQAVMEQGMALHGRGVDASLAKAVALGLGASVRGTNWSIRALISKDGSLGMWESLKRYRSAQADDLIDSGEVWMKLSWALEISDVPEAIEIGTARDHISGVHLEYAERCEDVFFMHHGQRMVLARFFDQVRDTSTRHQYQVQKFLGRAKDGATVSTLRVDAPAPPERRGAKGYDL